MQLRRILLIGSFIVSLVLMTVVVSAQDTGADDATATPAPSKTPMPEAVPVEETTAAEQTSDLAVDRTLPRAYTQEDLQVLVGNVQRPNGFVWLNNNLYTACAGDWTLYEINSETGATRSFVFGIQNAHTLVAEDTDAGFNLWIPDFEQSQVMRVDHRRGSPAVVTGDNLDAPWGMVALDEEWFLVSNIRSNTLATISKSGESQIVMADLRNPAGLAIDGDYAYVVNNGSARRAIEWFELDDINMPSDADPATGVTQPLVQGLQNASGVVMADDGYLYFTYALGTRGVVGRVDPAECRDGGCTNDQVEIVLFTELQAPLAGLTISPDMRLFIHTIFRPEIYWVRLYPEMQTDQE